MTTEIKTSGQLISPDQMLRFRTEIEKEFAIELNAQVNSIKLRTRDGKDKNDQPFLKLTDRYAKLKSGSGRANEKRTPSKEGKINKPAPVKRSSQINPTDLTWSGDMLKALTFTTEKTGGGYVGRIGFSSGVEAKKALGHITGGKYGQYIRDFFGLTKDFEERLAKRIQQIWSK